MPFIGTQPEVGGYSVLDALTASATASYTLQKDSANFVPNTANQLLVSLNGVIQKPGSSFTVSGSTLTFSSALSSSDSIDFVLAMGEPLLIGTPSDGTVSAGKIATDAVTTAKIQSGAIDGSHLSANAFMIDTWYHAADIVASGSSFLVGDSDSSSWTNQTSNTNRGSSRMSEDAGKWTFPSTGIYKINFFGTYYADNNDVNMRFDILTTTDNSTYVDVARQAVFHTAVTQYASGHVSYIFDVTNVTTHKVKLTMDSSTGATIKGGTLPMYTYAIFERLGNT